MSFSKEEIPVGIIIQARLGSKRLPQKVLKPLAGSPLIAHLVKRLKTLPYPIFLAVPRNETKYFSFLKDDVIFFEGSEDDVLSRYYECAKQHNIKTIIRVTADNPLTSEFCLEYGLKFHLKAKAHLSHVLNIPYGSGVEFIDFKTLETMHRLAKENDEKEHVTAYAYKHAEDFHIQKIPPPKGYESSLRVTIDTLEDFETYKKLVEEIGLEKDGYLSLEKVLKLNHHNPY